MKRSRYSEQQIVKILKEAEAGVGVEELSRKYGFGKSTFYKWKAKYVHNPGEIVHQFRW